MNTPNYAIMRFAKYKGPEISRIEEPIVKAEIMTPKDYVGSIMTLCQSRRGNMTHMEYLTETRVLLTYDIPLNEVIYDFFDALKSRSRGYASFDYHQSGFRPSKLIKLDILLNGESVDALSTLTHVDNSVSFGRRMCEKLKELIPRQQFDIAIQAAIDRKSVV